MDELRFVRREDLAFVVANDVGEEFRLLVDDAVLAELRHLSRKDRPAAKIRPREIQALLRAGNTRAEVAEQTGLEESDILRYEEPVVAERRYIQSLADDVLVRADSDSDAPQRFGQVIASRLRSLDAEATEWSTWRDEGADWSISVAFTASGADHRAIWSFDHRKGVLSPENADAVNLSKQGEIGEQLIPKLRAVDSQRPDFDAAAFETAEETPAEASAAEQQKDEAAIGDPDAEYERRREIEQRAMSTDPSGGADLSHTADLLDALKARRGRREKELEEATERHPSSYSGQQSADPPSAGERTGGPKLWSVPGVGQSTPDDAAESTEPENTEVKGKQGAPRKGRASVPSWDDILFGTRSDDD